jgi:hypothetical protein
MCMLVLIGATPVIRRGWLVKWTNGNGAKVCPGGGVATAGASEGEH